MTAQMVLDGDPDKVNVAGYTKGDVLAADTTGTLTPVPVGPDADVLTANSADAEGIEWAASSGGSGTPSNTVVAETTYSQASTAGVSLNYSRGDHTHGTPALPTPAAIGLGNVDNTSDANKPVSTATQTALNLKADLASPTFTGTVTLSGRQVSTPDTLVDAATIAVDASQGNYFRCLLTAAVGATRVLGTPTNPTDGQKIIIEFIQSATGSNAITFSGGWGFGATITGATLSTAANKHDFLGAVYNSTSALWYVIAFTTGY